MAHHPSVTPLAPIRGPYQLSQDSRIFLSRRFDDWLLDPRFVALNEFVQDFHFVNGVAESAVQMVTYYTESITKNKAQRKFLVASTVPQQRRDHSKLCQKVLQISIKIAINQENKLHMTFQNS